MLCDFYPLENILLQVCFKLFYVFIFDFLYVCSFHNWYFMGFYLFRYILVQIYGPPIFLGLIKNLAQVMLCYFLREPLSFLSLERLLWHFGFGLVSKAFGISMDHWDSLVWRGQKAICIWWCHNIFWNLFIKANRAFEILLDYWSIKNY